MFNQENTLMMTIAYQVNILYQNGELTDITKLSEVKLPRYQI
jgi:hypothetical protein